MLKLAVNDQFDEFLKLSFRFFEYELQVIFAEAMALQEVIVFQKLKHICSCQVPLTSPVNSLEKCDRAKLSSKAILKIESKVEEVSFLLHQALFSLDQGNKELTKKELGIA